MKFQLSLIPNKCVERPKLTIFIYTIICLILGSFIRNANIITKGEDLWYDPDTVYQEHLDEVREVFPTNAIKWSAALVIPKMNMNIFSNEVIEELFDFHERVISIAIEENLEVKLLFNNILGNWGYNKTSFYDNVDLLKYCDKIINSGNINTFDFSKFSSDSDNCYAKTMRMFYYISSDNDDDITEWMNKYNDFSLDFESTISDIYGMSDNSIDNEIAELMTENIHLLGATLLCMVFFVCFTFGYTFNLKNSRIVLALSSMFFIILSMGASFGFGIAVGYDLNPTVILMPFLLLSVGIDGSYITLAHFDEEKHTETQTEVMKKAMSTSCESIGMAYLTTAIVMILNYTSPMPALHSFGFVGMVNIIVLYIFQITAFPCMVLLDENRKNQRRYDILCCKKFNESKTYDTDTKSDESSNLSKTFLFHGRIQNFIKQRYTYFTVLIIYTVFVAWNIYNVINVDINFDPRELISDDSYVNDFLDNLDFNYDKSDEKVYLYHEDLIVNKRVFDDIGSEIEQISKNKFMKKIMKNWYSKFKQDTNYDENLDFDFFNAWLDEPDNLIFKSDLDLYNNRIMYSKIPFIQTGFDDAENYEDMLSGIETKSENSYIFHSSYPLMNLVKNIPKNTLINIIIAVVVLGFIVAASLRSCFYVVIGIICITTELLFIVGLLYPFGIPLNTITMMNILLSIGISVDGLEHILHSTKHCGHINESLKHVGLPITMGYLTTAIGISLTVFSSSLYFRNFFYIFCIMLVVSAFHSLLIFPCMFIFLEKLIPKRYLK